eukprot:scaffold69175_cov60-Phaeocystis_antarctica.AAC.2
MSPVLADATTATVLAPAALPSVLADAAAAALLALAAHPAVLAEAAAAALLALGAPPPVLADATAAALLALAALPPVLALLASHSTSFTKRRRRPDVRNRNLDKLSSKWAALGNRDFQVERYR